MNAIDIAILVVLSTFLGKGLWLGLVHELCGLAGLGVGTILAARYHAPLAETLPAWANLPPWLVTAACFATLFLVTLICFGLLGVVLARFLKLIFLGGLNRVLGGLFGLVQGVLLLALALYGLSATDWLKATRQQSRLAPPFAVLGEQLFTGGRQLLR
jgi:membrane protein required for colicin V production